VNERFAHDLEYGDGGFVTGADEAGRGCLAGPLVAAAVRFGYETWSDHDYSALRALDDSKKLSRKVRGELYPLVLKRADEVAVVAFAAPSIDSLGLQVCNIRALERCLALLTPSACPPIVDGYALGSGAVPHVRMVGGDGRSAAVAAASVVAKVTRDRLMVALHERFPDYGFDRHKGYACADHQQAIAEHGVCELHRLSFQSVAYQQLGLDLLR
jgi:ribonuclease HII